MFRTHGGGPGFAVPYPLAVVAPAPEVPMRAHLLLGPLALALTLAVSGGRAGAEDEPVAPPPPALPDAPPPPVAADDVPPGEGLPPGVVDPAAGFDFRDVHASLVVQLDHIAQVPRRTATDHALYDIWVAAIKPRLPRLKQALTEMGRDVRFEVEPDTHRAIGIASDQWPRFIREAAALHAGLAGALDGYMKSNVKITSPFGLGLDQPAGLAPEGYPIEALGLFAYERELNRRLLLGHHVAWPDEVHAYRAFLARLQFELARREEAWRRREIARQNAALLADAAAAYEAAIGERVDELGVMLLSVRTLVATLQAVEEDRLHRHVAAVDPADPGRAALDAHLVKLRSGRLEARRRADESAGRYGSLLRTDWLGPRFKLLKALGEAVVEEPVDVTSPDEPDASEQGTGQATGK